MKVMLQENRAILWEMKDAANAQEHARKLEAYRNTYFQDLYHDIIIFSVRYSDVTDERGFNPSVESQALRIIDAKEAYDKRIMKFKIKSYRWQTFIQSLDEETARLLEEQVKRNGQELRGRLKRKLEPILARWEDDSRKREKQEEKAAKAQLVYMKKKHPELFEEHSKKRPYLIDGKTVFMTQFDYEWEQRKKEIAEQDAKWERIFAQKHHRANETSNAL